MVKLREVHCMSRMKQGWWNLGERNCRYCLKWMCIAMLVSHFYFYLLFIFYLFILLVYAFFFFFDSICFLSSEFIHVNWHMVMKNIYCSSSKTVKSEEKKSISRFFDIIWASPLGLRLELLIHQWVIGKLWVRKQTRKRHKSKQNRTRRLCHAEVHF